MEGTMEVQRREPLQDGHDPVLLHLSQALSHYRELKREHEERAAYLQEMETRLVLERARAAELQQETQTLQSHLAGVQVHHTDLTRQYEELQAEVAALQAQNATLARQAETLHSQVQPLQAQNASLAEEQQMLQTLVDRERERAEGYKQWSNRLTGVVKDLHKSLFSGNVHELILRACITVTQATCGIYVVRRDSGSLRVRASLGMGDNVGEPPSEFIAALCNRVLADNDTLVLPEEAQFSEFPQPTHPEEQFYNAIVAPVVLLKNFAGIVIVANKENGDFREEDVEVLLSVGDQAAVAVENERLYEELQSAYLSIVSVLADAAEAKDPYTHGHCELVSRYARLTANRMNISEEERSIVCFAALLHDIGKIGVSDGILHKVGRLLPEERDLIRSHVRIGYELLSKVPALQQVAHVVLYHHEWYDGSGYPNGLKGEAIPLAARIVSVVDAYCAMITRRSYKEEFSEQRAREELIQYSGTQFDPEVVQVFLQVLDLPESEWEDDDHAAECGMLPGYGRARQATQESADQR
jgi:putative nucleotidyltransferase with HDIG domain